MSYCPCGRSTSQSTAAKRPRSAPLKNEDWSEVRDPVERRKMQNRIAQRNYRERRADTSLRSFAKARIGKRIRRRLALLGSRVSAERASSESGSRECVRPCEPQSLTNASPHEFCTASLHPSRDSHLQGRNFTPWWQHADGLSDDLPYLTPSSPSTSSLAAEAAARPIDRSLHASSRLPAAAVCLTAPFALHHSPTEEHYIYSDSSPFEEGYLAMNGTSAAPCWHRQNLN